ncbi:MAG: single-stranded-DNA-specific exonuclease RecJ, partial [Chloroflexota bacterium]|nr:single-stranded-DNA-specific exonuclease RecJ [Chloroflexota bacterium]
MTQTQLDQPLPKIWRVHHPIPDDISKSLHEFSPLLRQLLYNRGYQDPESAAAFLAGTVTFPTDPFLLSGMAQAVARLNRAIRDGERIVVYGDYDADGVTSTALLIGFLSSLGVEARPYIPDRYEEGYGLNEQAIRQLAEEGTDLVITVDCGVRAVKEVSLANDLGIDVIVSDHHVPGADLPPAFAVIDPKQLGDPYPEKYLAGVGLAYKLVQAYLTQYPQEGVCADDWLDLVAIGTVVDLAPLKGENRMLVRAGLEKIRRDPRQGIFSLAQVARIDLNKCNASNLGFGLGPRLNAAGRMESALTSFNLLTTSNPRSAGQLAQLLDSYNKERQDITQEIRETASDMVLSEDPEAVLFFAAHPDFSEGVVGLAASRLVESYYRPSIVGHQGETFTVASCRSIPEFHITRALDECADLLVRHGGHAVAAGFTVRNENKDALVARLRENAAAQLGEMELIPELKIDRKIKLDKLTGKHISTIMEDLHKLEPTGRGNPEPVFASYDVAVRYARAVGRESSHLKLTLQAGANNFDAIA